MTPHKEASNLPVEEAILRTVLQWTFGVCQQCHSDQVQVLHNPEKIISALTALLAKKESGICPIHHCHYILCDCQDGPYTEVEAARDRLREEVKRAEEDNQGTMATVMVSDLRLVCGKETP